MTEQDRRRRAYRSAIRQDRAAETRAAVVAAARTLFVKEGWHGTTIAAVAREAGVSAESVYAIFGNKPRLLLAVVQATVRRADPRTPLVEQPGPRAVANAPDQATALQLFAADITEVLSGVAELVSVIRVAAETEPEVATVYEAIHRGRRDNLALLTRALASKGPLRPGVTEQEALSQTWRLASPELFLLLTRTEGMAVEDYARWLERILGTVLLVNEG